MTASDTTILICDDSILARKQLSDAILASFPSVKIIEANNGQEAMRKQMIPDSHLSIFN